MIKNMLLASLIICYCSISSGSEWEIRPNPVYYNQYYYCAPNVVYVPVVATVQYVPVIYYQNVIVEKYNWQLIKTYEVVPKVNTVYLPISSIKTY